MTEHLLPTTSLNLSWIPQAGFPDHRGNRKCSRTESIKCSWKVLVHVFVLQSCCHRQTPRGCEDAKGTPRQAVIQAIFPQPRAGWASGSSSSRQGRLWHSTREAHSSQGNLHWEMLPQLQDLLAWETLKSSRSLLYTLKAHFEWPHCSDIFITHYIVQCV